MTIDERLATIERRLSDLEAAEAIRHVLSLYARGIDDDRPELLQQIIADDCRLRTMPWGVDTQGKDRVLLGFRRYRERFKNPRRYYANEAIRVEGERATAFTYWFVAQADGEESIVGWGTYDWAFRREEAGWKVTELTIKILAMTTPHRGWATEAMIMPFERRT